MLLSAVIVTPDLATERRRSHEDIKPLIILTERNWKEKNINSYLAANGFINF